MNPRGELSAVTLWERGLGTAQIAFGEVNWGLAFRKDVPGGAQCEGGGCREGGLGS